MKDAYLIRHGEARSGPSGMDRDFHLTDLGRRQARRCGERLAERNVRPARIYASRLTRARETAEIIARHVPAPVALRDDLIEHGSAALLLDCDRAEAARHRPVSLSPDGSLKVDPGGSPGLNPTFAVGGETLAALHQRARGAWKAILAAQAESDAACLVVAHGSFLSVMASDILSLPAGRVWALQFANAAVLHIRLHADPVTGEPAPAVLVHGPDGEFAEGPTRSEKVDREIDNR